MSKRTQKVSIQTESNGNFEICQNVGLKYLQIWVVYFLQFFWAFALLNASPLIRIQHKYQLRIECNAPVSQTFLSEKNSYSAFWAAHVCTKQPNNTYLSLCGQIIQNIWVPQTDSRHFLRSSDIFTELFDFIQ